MNQLDFITVYTDGACRGNPGKGGWGVLIDLKDETVELLGHEQLTTNNRMELLAALKALEYLYENNYNRVVIHTDSKYLKNGMQSWLSNWKNNNWKTASNKPVKNKDIWLQLDLLNSKMNVDWMWVKGHSGNEKNDYVDSLANQAIDQIS